VSRITDRKEALETLKGIDQAKKDYLVIHYSSESFYDLGGKSPRITSIAVDNHKYGQSELFAIYKSAEKKNIDFGKIPEQYAEIEKSMLEDYFHYLESNKDKIWLHWNMRDSIFGFKAIEHRFTVLGGSPFSLPDSNQINIATLLRKLYGPNYISDPKMVSLMQLNNLHPKNFMSGEKEAEVFKEGNFYELSMSTAGKVRMFSQIIDLAIDNTLKTNTSTWSLYGTNIKSIWYSLTERTWFFPVSYTFTTILGAIISHFVTKGLP
jgi:hypothetical protein